MPEIYREELGSAGGYEKLTTTSVVSITASVRKPESGIFKGMEAKAAYVTVETQVARFKEYGVASASAGHLINAAGNYTVRGRENVKNFNIIDTGAGGAAVHVTVYF